MTTIIEYKINDEGKKVKVTRKIKRTLVKSTVNHAVAERMHWTKFGAEKGHAAGPDRATTTVGEAVRLKLTAGGLKKEDSPEEDENAALRAQLATKKITCRLCQGDHYTTRCPHKETLGNIIGDPSDTGAGADGPGGAPDGASASEIRAAGGKYVPPSMRAGAAAGGETMNGRSGDRDNLPTLRVTNLSEDATDSDMWELFARFGKVNRIFLGKDFETGLCKGFAFVTFEDRREAEKALEKVNGLPYDHLILGCAWSSK